LNQEVEHDAAIFAPEQARLELTGFLVG